MTEEIQKEFRIDKREDGRYDLVTVEGSNESHDWVTKDKLKDIYGQLKDARANILAQMNAKNKVLKTLPTDEPSEEVKEFVRLAKLSEDYAQRDEAQEALKGFSTSLDRVDTKLKQIERMVPEWTRKK